MSHKKLFIALSVFIGLAALLLSWQIRLAKNITTRTKTLPLIESVAVNIPIDKTDPILGNPGAPLTVTEFVDLGNEKSRSIHATIADFVVKNPTEARLIWKDYPSAGIFGGNSFLLHQAAYCAGQEKKFWPFITELLKRRMEPKEAGLKDTAKQARLNIESWWLCANAPTTKQYVTSAAALAQSLNIKSAPAVFLNNKRINLEENIDLAQMLATLIKK